MIPLRNNWARVAIPRAHRRERFRRCNLCRRRFVPVFRYQLFCSQCRKADDSFLFAEWLPKTREDLPIASGQ